MRAAAVAAKELDLPLQLIDRDLATTLKRSYARVPWYKRLYLMAGLALGMVSSEEIDEESIEKLKEGDILESTFTEFAERHAVPMPQLRKLNLCFDELLNNIVSYGYSDDEEHGIDGGVDWLVHLLRSIEDWRKVKYLRR